MRKMPKLKFQKGNIGLQLNEFERRYLIEVIESFWDAEADSVERFGSREAEDKLFLCERLRHRFYGYKIEKTKYDRQNQKTECDGCGRELTYPEMHRCKGHQQPVDPEILARI